MIFLIPSDGWRQHKLFPPLSPAKTENADNSSCPIDSFSSYSGWGQTSLLAVIVLIFILKLQLDLPLAGKLSLTFTCRDKYWPCDAIEEAKTWYSIVNNPVSWNFYTDRANLHYLVRWALFMSLLKEFYTNTDWYSGKGDIMLLKLPNQIKSTSFSSWSLLLEIT